MKNFKNILFVLLTLLVASCQTEEVHVEHEHMIAVTQWTDKMEIFLEYPEPVVGQEGNYLIHLTYLENFKPVLEGKVKLIFTGESGTKFTFEKNELLREGIFTPAVNFSESGKFNFTLEYAGSSINETFNLGEIEVYASHEELEEHEESEGEEAHEGITFLKEQQWKTEFATSTGQYKVIKPSLPVVGEVLPHQHGYAEIVAPVEGILSVDHNQEMVTPGSKVSKGNVLVTICPTIGGSNSWTDLQLAYEKSKAEFERAERLLNKEAISQREYDEFKRNYMIQKAGYDSFFQISQGGNSKPEQSLSRHLELRSPIAGTVAEVIAKPGQSISVGQHLLTLLDPTVVWIKMNIFEKDYFKLGQPSGAEVNFPGLETPIYLGKDKWQIISRGEFVDPASRTIPLIVEIKNRDGMLKVGQSLQINLFTSEEKEVLCVPAKSIFEEDVQKFLFVQVEGETFEKRIVETGASYQGWIEIKSGINEGEKIVTKGAYMVKLASANTNIGHPHAH